MSRDQVDRAAQLSILSPAIALVLTCVAVAAEPPDNVELTAQLDRQTSQVYVGLSNAGGTTYNFMIGSLCGSYGWPEFQFTLRRRGLRDEPLILAYNQNPNAVATCGHALPWIIALPRATRYGFRFPLEDLRLDKRTGNSLATLKNAPYEIEVSYTADVGDDFVSRWNEREFPKLPFWKGTLGAKVESK